MESFTNYCLFDRDLKTGSVSKEKKRKEKIKKKKRDSLRIMFKKE